MAKDDKKQDVFDEAAEMAFASIREKQVELDEEAIIKAEIVTEEDQQALAEMHTAEGDKWNNLAKYVNGEGADRLMSELKTMSGRDFVRNYLKLLEHFKPKLVRSDNAPDEEADKVIQVEMVQRLPNGEIRTITINGPKKEE